MKVNSISPLILPPKPKKEFKLPSMCATYRGYNLHAGVVVGARNRKGLEGLCRYIMRPPLAKDRLKPLGDGSYDLRLKTPWADGTTSLRLTAMEVMERLASLVPVRFLSTFGLSPTFGLHRGRIRLSTMVCLQHGRDGVNM